MKSGKADRRITIERATVTTDEMGGEISTWSPLCSPWAEINYGKGDERRQAAQESASVAATFRVRANPVTNAVVAKDRIRFDGWAWDITSNVPYRRDARDITATTAFDPASALPAAVMLFGSATLGATLSGSLRAAIALGGAVTASGGASGAISAAAQVSGAVVAMSTAAGALTSSGLGFAGTVFASGLMNGGMLVEARMAGAATGASSAAAAIVAAAKLAGNIAGNGSPAADLTVSAPAGLPSFAYQTESTNLLNAMTAAGSTPNARRAYTYDRTVSKLKAAGLWSKLLALYIVGDTEAQWRINLANPGTYNLIKQGAPTFAANSGVSTTSTSDFYDTGIPMNVVPQNGHVIGVYTNNNFTPAAGANNTGYDFGAVAGASGANGLAGPGLAIAAYRNGTNRIATYSMSAPQTSMAGTYGQAGFHAVNRADASTVNGFAHGQIRGSNTLASMTVTDTTTLTILKANGVTTVSSLPSPRAIAAAFVLSSALSEAELQQFYAIITTHIEAVQYGDVDYRPAGFAPAAVTADVVVYGATSQGVVAAYELARLGRSVAIVGGWRERNLGGMSANGLGGVDFNNHSALGGLSRWFITRMNQLMGLADTSFVFVPRFFGYVCKQLLDPSRAGGQTAPVFWSTGVVSAGKTGTKITSFTTGDGRTFTAKYFVDASYEGDLLAAGGCSYATGREAAGTGAESASGYRGLVTTELGSNHQFKVGSTLYNIDPFVTPGDPGSGLLPNIEYPPARTVGQADNDTQAYNFRVTMTTSANRLVTIPNTPPAGYNIQTYEPLLRMLAAAPTATIASFLLPNALPANTYDVNATGGMSTDLFNGANPYVAATTNAQRESAWKAIERYIRGFFHVLKYETDTRVTGSTLKTGFANYNFDGLHYLDVPDGDALFWPPQLYVREFRRLVGDIVWNGNDLAATDGTAPRSTKTATVASYALDSHHSRSLADNSTGTWRIWNTGNFEATMGGSNGYAPVPVEAFLPKASECTNLAVPFCTSATHVAFGSIRMELTTMQAAQTMAHVINYALNNGETALQLANYPAVAASLAASPSLPGEVAPFLPQTN